MPLISSLNGRDELKNLFDAITINETYFFRADFQFDALEKQIIPELVKKNQIKQLEYGVLHVLQARNLLLLL